MRRAPLRPVHRVASVATVALLTLGMGVLGTSAAVADDLPVGTATPAPSAPAAGDAVPAVSAPPAAGPVEVEVEVEALAPATVIDEVQEAAATPGAPAAEDVAVAPGAPAAEDGVVGVAAATEPGTVAVSGTTGIGDLQTAVTDGWPEGTTFTYQWTRDGQAVEGATDETYLLVQDDAGRVVEVAVTGTGPAADDEPTTVSSQRGLAAGTAPVITSRPGTRLTAVAGEPFSFTWEAEGDPVPDFSLTSERSPSDLDLPEGIVVTEAPGSLTISGTTTVAMPARVLGVEAVNRLGVSEHLAFSLTVEPAATAGIVVSLLPATFLDDIGTSFRVGPDDVREIPVDDGAEIAVLATTVDAYGNTTSTPADRGRAVVTSTDASDVVSTTGVDDVPSITFHGAGSRTASVSLDGFSVSFPVQVRGDEVAAPAGSVVTPVVTTGHLAHTGTDSATGLLALAVGLLSAGAALTVVRLRRRVQL